MQRLSLSLLSFFYFTMVSNSLPINVHERPSRAITSNFTMSATSPTSSPRYVVAHHIVGNTFPYTSQDWLNDIKLANASGIDGFALNIGRDSWQPDRVADAYAAAQNSLFDFKMFLSLDMSSLPCASSSDGASLRALVTTYLSHPNQLRYSRGSSTQLPLVSTFAGESCKFGQSSVADGWRSQFAQHPDLQGKMTFVPSFFVAPDQMSQFSGIVNGVFNWNGGWPVELTTASAGSSSAALSSSLKNLLGFNSTSNPLAKFTNLLGGSPSIQVANSAGKSLEQALSKFIASPDSDRQFLQSVSTSTAKTTSTASDNVYIAAVTPWFYTHFGKDSFNKNFLYVADQHLFSKRWESLIVAQAPRGNDTDPTNASASPEPSIANQVDIVEIISWNDYGESHYVGPIKGAQPPGSEAWTDGLNHTAWLSLTSYYAQAFKTGSYPVLSLDEERMVMWSRTHPASAIATSDSVGTVPGSELVLDAVWATVLLSEPANVTLQVVPSSNSSSTAPLASQTFLVPAGLNKLTIPIFVPDSGTGVSMRGIVERGEENILELDAGAQGFEFIKTPQQFNFNAWVGCAGEGCVPSHDTFPKKASGRLAFSASAHCGHAIANWTGQMSRVFDIFMVQDGNDTTPDLPPGSPPTLKFEGPWLTTQLILSGSIGLFSFLIFSYARTRWPLLFAPRTKLKGFSPHEAHAHQAFFGWILPTIRTSEFTVLQIVGLDAAVLLNFFKMSFYLFSVCSFFAITALMPLNWKHNKKLGDDNDGNSTQPDDDWNRYLVTYTYTFDTSNNSTLPTDDSWLGLISDPNTFLSVHLVFTYLFTSLALYFIYKNYRRFIRSRQLFSLELVHSIPARTVMVTNLPKHLRGERPLAEYFESMNMSVESVSVVREVGSLERLLYRRTKALLKLEDAWAAYVGNPSTVEEYDPENNAVVNLIEPDSESGPTTRLVVPHRQRPTLRPGWFRPKVDALEYLDKQFSEIDEIVKRRRRTGKFKATQTAFVTFEKMSSAQIALQTAHAPNPFQCVTYASPEPRDIIWSNMTTSDHSLRARDVFIVGAIAILFFFWVIPIAALASLLSYEEIKKALPWLAYWINKSDKIQALVQNSLPSMAMITLNALLPFALEALTYLQGYRARSWVEYSLMKKYHLFLLFNVVFIFLVASTYWQLARDLANFPAKIPTKLAKALQSGKARNFFLSYAILQGLGIMPLQLLNLGVIIPQVLMRMLFTKTPRDFAELNAPPMINYGVVYPQAILMFTITMLYSVVQPLIVIFGAIYFGVAYVVYKYKLLFVFYKPYESQGQAWPLTYVRLIWGVIIFLMFMTGFFLLSQSFVLSSLLIPLWVGTLFWSWWAHKKLTPLSEYVNLSSVFEVERGEETADVARLKMGHPVTWSQSNLSRRRYAQNDDTLYVAPEDERTDYSQPPMANWYNGVLNTGKRRYGHPALNGVLPEPWLPLKKGQTLTNHESRHNGASRQGNDQAVVLTLRKRPSTIRRSRLLSTSRSTPGSAVDNSNPWEDTPSPRRSQTSPSVIQHRLSFDHASGVIMMPDDEHWLIDDVDSDEEDDYSNEPALRLPAEPSRSEAVSEDEDSAPGPSISASPRISRYGTYFHHPEKRRQTIPGSFPVSRS
ncbi:hypothetical protein D9757_014508 [Collybiopsis confluens]|uniref:Uncharacterized protein n=1 Tax=Collybiopsis confluens TaxID=2823264 RepID=A0A8H5CJ65_9AGAR|nr:hypothetical protein D9757_014508 [Collybiopsis confluens]